MRGADLIRFARDAATGNPLRTSLLILAMAIGVAAVVILTMFAARAFDPRLIWPEPAND